MQKVLLVACAVLVIPPAFGQAEVASSTPAERGAGELQEVVVTAQRRTESLQEVPISISAFTATDLERAGMNEARDYLTLSPNVSFADDGQTGNRSIRIAIRGVSNVSLGDRAVPNALGYYIDEFNVGTVANGTINPALLDLQRVEVLRGPQGTYFGRNSSGGAINISTNLPDNHWFAEAAAYGGNFDTHGGRLIVNAPVSDTFFLRGVVGFESSTGIVKNINPNGTPNSGYDQTDARLAARWLVTDRLTADFSYTYSHDSEGLDADVNTGVLELDTIGIEGPGFRPISDGLGFYPQNQTLVDHRRYEWNRNQLDSENLRLSYDFDSFTLKSITGEIKTRNSRMFDEDAVSVDTIYRHNEWHAESYGEELRLQSKPGGALDWVVGALYARDKVSLYNLVALGTEFSYTYPDTGMTVGLAPPFPNLPVNENLTGYIDRSVAAYGELTWRPIDKWAFTLGGRFTHDEIDDTVTGLVAFGTPQPDLAGNSSFNDFSPRLVATYKLSADANLYASISHGYKAGGNDLNGALPQHTKPFSPEKIWNYEVGYKSEFWDHRALLNASAFYLKWKDLQSEVNYLVNPTDISSAVQLTENASSASSKGVDVELRVRPIEPLTLGLSAGYLKATFGSFPTAVVYGVPVDLSGLDLPQSPHFTGSAVAEWAQPITTKVDGYVRYEEVYRSQSESNLEGVAAGRLGLGTFPFQMPSFAVANLHAGISDGGWSVNGSVENLFDKEYYTGTGDHFGFGGVRVRPHPRMWRLELVYRTH
jgi:iron complex outermembrane recepter protein